MEFRTEITIPEPDFQISHSTHIMSLGSCFAENISDKLRDCGFNILSNPFGVLFNPSSIANAIDRMIGGRMADSTELLRHNDLWHSFDFHGSFSGTDPETALAKMNGSLRSGMNALNKSEIVIITFGTAWVFELAGRTGRIVANCHKFPSDQFSRRKLSVSEIVERYSELTEGPLREKKIIFTVSPVRHLKDGFAGNSASKAALILATEELCSKYDNAYYFPAFEIVTDDLRDYRFYAEDMVHPSAAAVDYIWGKFARAFFTPDTFELAKRIEKISRASNHRPGNTGIPSHRYFVDKMLGEIEKIEELESGANLERQKAYFSTDKPQ